MAYLYVILSRTATGSGKLIRTFTRYYYNHVSLSLHEDLSGIVSFARYCIDTPMYAGYVAEPVERFLYAGTPVPIRVFRVEITEEKAHALANFFSRAGDSGTGLLYNHLAALAAVFRLPCPIPGAYTCLSFVATVLGKKYRSFQELERDLAPYEVFCGDFQQTHQDSGLRTDRYFTRRGLLGRTKDSVLHSLRLLARCTRVRKFDDPIVKLR